MPRYSYLKWYLTFFKLACILPYEVFLNLRQKSCANEPPLMPSCAVWEAVLDSVPKSGLLCLRLLVELVCLTWGFIEVPPYLCSHSHLLWEACGFPFLKIPKWGWNCHFLALSVAGEDGGGVTLFVWLLPTSGVGALGSVLFPGSSGWIQHSVLDTRKELRNRQTKRNKCIREQNKECGVTSCSQISQGKALLW